MLRQVMGIVDAKQTGEHELTLEWESSASNDMVADSALALITGIDKSPASAKRKHLPSKSPLHSSCRTLGNFLEFRVYAHEPVRGFRRFENLLCNDGIPER